MDPILSQKNPSTSFHPISLKLILILFPSLDVTGISIPATEILYSFLFPDKFGIHFSCYEQPDEDALGTASRAARHRTRNELKGAQMEVIVAKLQAPSRHLQGEPRKS